MEDAGPGYWRHVVVVKKFGKISGGVLTGQAGAVALT